MDSHQSNLIPLNKIHRFLRPLKSSLNAFILELDLIESRQSTSSSSSHNVDKGKGKARKSFDDSPFGESRKKLLPKIKSTYGQQLSRKPESQPAPPRRSSGGRGGERSAGERSGGGDIKTRLIASGIPKEGDIINKFLLVLKAFTNILTVMYSPPALSSSEVVVKEMVIVPSLVELTSRIIGFNLESFVQESLIESSREEEEGQGGVGGEVEEDFSRARKGEEIELEESRLLDEWYEILPGYCRREVFIQHATSILITSLQKYSNPILLLLVLELCINFNAINEAKRFFEPLLILGFQQSSTTSMGMGTGMNLKTLYNLSLQFSQPQFFFKELQTVLIQSSFFERLFYSSFLDLRHLNLTNSSDEKEREFVVGSLEVLLEIGGEMLNSIQSAFSSSSSEEDEDEDEEEEEEAEIEKLSKEVTERLFNQLKFSLPFLLSDRPSSTTSSTTRDGGGIETISNSLFEFIETFGEEEMMEDLIPFGMILELKLVSNLVKEFSSTTTTSTTSSKNHDDISIDLASRLSRLSFLSLSFSSLSPPQSNILNYLPNLLGFESTQTIVQIGNLLHDSSLFELELEFLSQVVKHYYFLCDVTRIEGQEEEEEEGEGGGGVVTKKVFENSLKVVQELLFITSSSSTSTSIKLSSSFSSPPPHSSLPPRITEEKKWKYKTLIGTYSITTPSPSSHHSRRRRRGTRLDSNNNATPTTVREMKKNGMVETPSKSHSKVLRLGLGLGYGTPLNITHNSIATKSRSSKLFIQKVSAGRRIGSRVQAFHNEQEEDEEGEEMSGSEGDDIQFRKKEVEGKNFKKDKKKKIVEVLDLSSSDSDSDSAFDHSTIRSLSQSNSRSTSSSSSTEVLPKQSNLEEEEEDDIDFLSNFQFKPLLPLVSKKLNRKYPEEGTGGSTKDKKMKRKKRRLEKENEVDDELGM